MARPMATTPDFPAGKISVAAYLFHRLGQLGIQHVFGCPGDFNLNLLDHLYTIPSMHWVGTCNELNGAYAADGYARTRGIPGALITTYGVGELSAINGIAGAYSEHIPIIHIVGTTSRLHQRDRIMIHHTLDEDWDHTLFQKMSEPVRSAAAFLTDDAAFVSEIDRVVQTAVKTRRPVYLFIPMDVPDVLVDSSLLSNPLDLEIRNSGQEDVEDELVEAIVAKFEKASIPAVLVDVLAHRYGAVGMVEELLRLTDLPAYVTPLSKSVIDETSPNFAGLYNGQLSPSASVTRAVEMSDLLFHIGPLPSDSNTGGWSQHLESANLVVFHPRYVSIAGDRTEGVHFVPVLRKLVAAIEKRGLHLHESKPGKNAETNGTNGGTTNGNHEGETLPTGPLEQHHLWKTFDRYLQPDDCIIAEVGSAQYGTLDFHLPRGCQFFTQIYFSCIGFTVGALLGALVGRKELGRTGRALLFVGDGSLQMTVQELSTVFRNGFNPLIILINNSGYTIERIIHGPTQLYNDIAETWDHGHLLRFFGAPEKSCSYSAHTFEELRAVLDVDPAFSSGAHTSTIAATNEENNDEDDARFNDALFPRLLEVHLNPFDAPWMLTAQINITQPRAAAQLRAWDQRCGRSRAVLDSNLFDSPFALQDSPSMRVVRERASEGLAAEPNGLK
ncbi:MAG: hypothetical protein M1819_000927 [Sarea resinae]|nr:MAG: hypothetical protein M1819_000927 [Sarea resinae]